MSIVKWHGRLDRDQWLKLGAAAVVILLWVEAIILIGFRSQSVTHMWGLPIQVMRAAIVTAAVASLTLMALAWRFPRLGVLHGTYELILRVRQSIFWTMPLVVLLIPALAYIASKQITSILPASAFLLGAVLYYALDPRVWSQPDEHLLRWGALAVVFIGLVIRAAVLVVEWVWIDEGYYLSAAVSIVRGGHIAPLMMFLPEDLYLFPLWGHAPALYGLWAKIVGVGLIRARIFSYVVGMLALPAIYLTGRLWYGKRTAALTVAFAALSILFMESTIGRPDAIGLAAVSWVLLLHVYACQQNRAALHMLVGIAAVIALETHLVVSVLLFALGVFYLYEFILRLRQPILSWVKAPLIMYLAGALPTLALYLYLHIFSLPHPDRYFTLLFPPGLEESAFLSSRLALAGHRYTVFWKLAPLESIVIIASILAAAVRRTQADIHWLILMICAHIGYFFLGPVGEIHYDIYVLSILIGGSGALFTYFLGKVPQNNVGVRLAFTVASVVLISANIHTFAAHRQDRLGFEAAEVTPIVDYVAQEFPTSAALIGPPGYYPYLVQYPIYLNPYYGEAMMGPQLAGVEPNLYWQDVLLETWPVAWLKVRGSESPGTVRYPPVFDSYFKASHAQQPITYLWVIDPDLITDAPYAEASSGAALAMVAHHTLPEIVQPGAALDVDTMWALRSAIDADYEAVVSLVGANGSEVAGARQSMMSGWLGMPVPEWETGTFHDVRFHLELPATLPDGIYTLTVTLESEDGAGAACQPVCRFEVTQVRVEGTR